MKSKTRWFWLVSIGLILVLQACSIGPLNVSTDKEAAEAEQTGSEEADRFKGEEPEETIAEIEEPTEVIPVLGTECYT